MAYLSHPIVLPHFTHLKGSTMNRTALIEMAINNAETACDQRGEFEGQVAGCAREAAYWAYRANAEDTAIEHKASRSNHLAVLQAYDDRATLLMGPINSPAPTDDWNKPRLDVMIDEQYTDATSSDYRDRCLGVDPVSSTYCPYTDAEEETTTASTDAAVDELREALQRLSVVYSLTGDHCYHERNETDCAYCQARKVLAKYNT